MPPRSWQPGSGQITKPTPKTSTASRLFTAEEILLLQSEIRELVDRLITDNLPKSEQEKLQKCILVPSVWDQFRKSLPELDVREDEITPDSNSQLSQLQHKLREAGLLRPADISTNLEDVEARRYERWQDYGRLLLPKCMHKPWHNLVNAEFDVDIPFGDSTLETDGDDNQPDIQLVAFQDRIFQKICSLWIWGGRDQGKSSAAYQKFVQAYRDHRGQ